VKDCPRSWLRIITRDGNLCVWSRGGFGQETTAWKAVETLIKTRSSHSDAQRLPSEPASHLGEYTFYPATTELDDDANGDEVLSSRGPLLPHIYSKTGHFLPPHGHHDRQDNMRRNLLCPKPGDTPNSTYESPFCQLLHLPHLLPHPLLYICHPHHPW
jgi:hypothetical protein